MIYQLRLPTYFSAAERWDDWRVDIFLNCDQMPAYQEVMRLIEENYWDGVRAMELLGEERWVEFWSKGGMFIDDSGFSGFASVEQLHIHQLQGADDHDAHTASTA
jgi:hypothetical protein